MASTNPEQPLQVEDDQGRKNIETLTTVLTWSYRLISCILVIAGFSGCLFGIILGVVCYASFPDDGGTILLTIGLAGGLLILLFCTYNQSVVKQLWETTRSILNMSASGTDYKDALVQYIFNKLKDAILSELKLSLLGPLVMMMVLGLALIVGGALCNEQTPLLVGVITGAVLLSGSFCGACCMLPAYLAAVRGVDVALNKLKNNLAPPGVASPPVEGA